VSTPIGYPVPAAEHRVVDVVRRSRFVTTLARAADPDAARAFVNQIRAEFPDATHHCWAFVAGPPGSTTQVGMSDAGEPRGTAGRPMLAVLLHSGVGEVVAVSSRWFGGTKLGTGGLSRAYSAGVGHALEDLPRERMVRRVRVEVEVGYGSLDALRRLTEEVDGRVENEVFGSRVRCGLAIPVDQVEALRTGLADETGGEVTVVVQP